MDVAHATAPGHAPATSARCTCRTAMTLGIARSIIGASQSNRLSQRLGRTVLAVGIAVIGSVLFGTLHITS